PPAGSASAPRSPVAAPSFAHELCGRVRRCGASTDGYHAIDREARAGGDLRRHRDAVLQFLERVEHGGERGGRGWGRVWGGGWGGGGGRGGGGRRCVRRRGGGGAAVPAGAVGDG